MQDLRLWDAAHVVAILHRAREHLGAPMPADSIALLGPLEVTLDGAAVEVPGRGERALLSLLALDVGRRVPVQRLVESLWAEDLPADPTNALQLRVSKLRRAVGDVVVTEPAGYRLDLPSTAVDVHRFRELVARRRHREALALWRGDPLAEFAGQYWADLEATALGEERLQALADRIDDDLAAGRHAEVLGELDRLVAAHPARERFWAQLVLARYRCGQQGDALATFDRAREVLGEQFGLDPGPRLVELQAAVLRQDPALTPPTPTAATTSSPLGSIVGRDDEVERCRRALADNRLVTVVGPGGVGKTRLAQEVAHDLAETRDDGAVVVNLDRLDEAGQAVGAVAAAVGVDLHGWSEGPHRAAAVEALAGWFARRDCLLVLDGCERMAGAVADLVRGVLHRAPGVAVLATSRVPLGVAGGHDLPLGPLAPAAGADLFLQRAADIVGAEPDEADRAAATTIAARVDGLPLAIELAAAWRRSLPAATIAARLQDGLALLEHAGDRPTAAGTLREVVASSLDLLEDPEVLLFRRLAVLADTWLLEDAEAVAEGPGELGRPVVVALAGLVEHSLVVADNGRYRLLAPVAEVARERLAAAAEEDEVRAAHAAYFLDLARGAERGLRGPEQGRWLARLRASTANITAALAWARQSPTVPAEDLLEAAAGLGWFWFLGRHGDGRRELAAVLAATEGGAVDDAARGRALQARSIVLRPGGCLVHPDEEADTLAAASRDLLAAAGDEHRALLSAVMAEVRAIGGDDTVGAHERLAEAAAQLRSAGDGWGAALADFVAMELHVQQGDIDDAVAVGERARDGFERVGDAWGTSSVAGHLAHGLRLAGRYEHARAVLEVGREQAVAAGIRNTLCGIHVDLARIALHGGDDTAARRSTARARSLAEDLGNRMLLGMADVLDAALQLDRGRPEDARRRLRAAIGRFEAEGVPGGLAEALALTAWDEAERGDVGAAERHARRALDLAREMRDHGLAAQALEVLALVAARRGEHTDAATALGRAASVRREGGRPASRLEQLVVDRAATLARGALGEERFDELVAGPMVPATG